MIDWQQFAAQLGVAGILAVFFYLVFRAYMKRTDDLLEDKRLAEKALIENTKECAEANQKFLESSNQFNATAEAFATTMSNHLVHEQITHEQQTEALRELTKAIDKLCAYMDE